MAEMICSLDLFFSGKFVCNEHFIFNENEIDSFQYSFVKVKNHKDTFSLLFIKKSTNQIFSLIRIVAKIYVDDKFIFDQKIFLIEKRVDISQVFQMEALSFFHEASNQIVTILVISDNFHMSLLRMDQTTLYQPITRELLTFDFFVNEQYLMVLDYYNHQIEFISLFENVSFFRFIWPLIPITNLDRKDRVSFVHDFILVRLQSSINHFVTLMVKDANPYLNKQTELLTSYFFTPVYLKTDYSSLVFVGMLGNTVYVSVLKSTVVTYKLNKSQKKRLYSNSNLNNMLFSFYLVFMMADARQFLNLVNVVLPYDYIISASDSFQGIDVRKETQTIHLDQIFQGNIYGYSFNIQMKKEGSLEE